MTNWIPIKESLPDIDKPVLIFTDEGGMGVGWLASEFGLWSTWDDKIDGYMLNVTHWMPLPEPPSE